MVADALCLTQDQDETVELTPPPPPPPLGTGGGCGDERDRQEKVTRRVAVPGDSPLTLAAKPASASAAPPPAVPPPERRLPEVEEEGWPPALGAQPSPSLPLVVVPLTPGPFPAWGACRARAAWLSTDQA